MNRLLLCAGAAIGVTVAVMLRQTGRAKDESELWALATAPQE